MLILRKQAVGTACFGLSLFLALIYGEQAVGTGCYVFYPFSAKTTQQLAQPL